MDIATVSLYTLGMTTPIEEIAAAIGHVTTAPSWPADDSRDPIGVELFGKDHWSVFAYIECRIVDNHGVIRHDQMRCSVRRHPVMYAQKRLNSLDRTIEYPTRVKASATPDTNGVYPTAEVDNHDDYDCLDDLIAAGLLTVTMPQADPETGHFVDRTGKMILNFDEPIHCGFVTGMGEAVLAAFATWSLTERGKQVAGQVRAWRGDGGQFQNFTPDASR